MRPLRRAFYARSPVVVARALLGRMLVRETRAGKLAGVIVEVEAYGGARDPASHAYRGETPRNRVMFGPPGHAYVYVSYGIHHCLNVVTGRPGEASAVLVRALAAVAGEKAMARRRGVADPDRLMRGPGCVAQALGLTRAEDGADLTRGPLWIADRPADRDGRAIAAGRRIGITRAVARRWRFYLAGHPCVSAPRRTARRTKTLHR
ncbi:MAG: DNA-3-methyladenine glycosylase [Candidatus Eisenbacteria bacterium]|uniref:Putative 3-methyladenine DNA glycosylase n=1 Tax=Eiseniibacteriota bacterium TaxID=2212470 RepID=A0A9D6L6N5_UNCEI|nr:DNA-3-methyladenine glycosylase [Candidatus Eisenbacteria bacterium]MBI3538834.1 DNA-3-methyladenine glycosylase [Candidatus Eisenbacteria bacterium]